MRQPPEGDRVAKHLYCNQPHSSKTFYIIYLNTPIVPPRNNVRMLCAVTDMQMAYSWYIIRTDVNDRLLFTIVGGLDAGSYNIQVPEGNYDAISFETLCNTDLFPTAGLVNRTIIYDIRLNKFEFKVTDATSMTIRSKENGTTIDTEIGMGLVNDVTQTGGPPIGLYLPNMVDWGGIPNVYLMARSLSLQNRDGRGETNLTLCKLPVTTRPGGFLYLPKSQFVFVLLDDREIKRIELVLQDDEQNTLDLHGISWSITLSIHFQYQRYPDEGAEGTPSLILPENKQARGIAVSKSSNADKKKEIDNINGKRILEKSKKNGEQVSQDDRQSG